MLAMPDGFNTFTHPCLQECLKLDSFEPGFTSPQTCRRMAASCARAKVRCVVVRTTFSTPGIWLLDTHDNKVWVWNNTGRSVLEVIAQNTSKYCNNLSPRGWCIWLATAHISIHMAQTCRCGTMAVEVKGRCEVVLFQSDHGEDAQA